MRKLTVLFSIAIASLIVSCGDSTVEDANPEITSSIEKVAEKYGYRITYELMPSGAKFDSISIKVNNFIAYTATTGTVLEDCYNNLASQNIYLERYTIKNNVGAICISVTRAELEKAIECKKIAFSAIHSLAARDYNRLIPNLDTIPFTKDQIELTKQLAEAKLNGVVTEIGFEVIMHNNQLYGGYVALVDTNFTSVTINLTQGSCKVFGLKF